MPFSFEGLFRCSCIPFLRLEVVGATEVVVPGGQNYWVADYSAVAANITVEAYTVLGTHVDWTATTTDPGAVPGPVHDVTLHHTDRCRIPLDNDRNVVADGYFITVQATALGLTASVNIVVKPLVTALAVVPNHYAFQDAAGWYALNLNGIPNVNAAQLTAQLEVATTPNNAAARSHVIWGAINTAAGGIGFALAPVNDQRRGIPLDAVRTIQTTVRLANSPQVMPAAVVVDVRNPVVNAALANNLGLELHQFTFAGSEYFGVTQENAGNFNALFPAVWDRANMARPQGYAAQTAVGAATTMATNAVTVNVTAQPAGAPTTVTVRATAYYPLANGNLHILQGSTVAAPIAAGTVVNTNVGLGAIALAPNLPDEVMHNNPLLIFWEINDGVSWFPLQVTANTVYVTARPPVSTLNAALNVGGLLAGDVITYDSLLAICCDAAAGRAGGAGTANAVRDDIVAAFALPLNGNNARMQRLNRGAVGGPTQWEYWRNYLAGNPPAQSVNGGATLPNGGNLFNNPTGSVACGVWAKMLIMMWALQGKGDGRFIGVWSSRPRRLINPRMPAGLVPTANVVLATRFNVRNWDYNNHGALNPGNYTHTVIPMLPMNPAANQAIIAAGVSGQNNGAPPPNFDNHFIVRDGGAGDFYDPSYGTPARNRNNWVNDSIGGLRNDTTNTVGFVAANVGSPNGIQAAHNAVSLYDFNGGGWLP